MKSTIKKSKSKNWATDGGTLTAEEFKVGVKNAENGPFHTIDESKKLIAKWRAAKNSR